MPRRPEERLQTGHINRIQSLNPSLFFKKKGVFRMEGLQRAENPTQEYPNLIEIKWKQMEANGDEIPQARCPRLPAAPDSSPPQTPFRAPGSLPPQTPFRPSLPFAPASLPPQAPFRPRLLSARRAAARRV